MIIDRTHIRWATFTIGTAVVLGFFYGLVFYSEIFNLPINHGRESTPIPLTARAGGTLLGLIYGSAALLIFVFAALLGWRRKHPSWRLGCNKIWLKAHIWLTILTVPLIVFHSGFHGGGFMTQLLLWLYGFVMVSGFFGLALQHILPKLMRLSLPEEVIFEQIPFLCEKLVAEGRILRNELFKSFTDASKISTSSWVLNNNFAGIFKLIDEEVLPYLSLKSIRNSRFAWKDSSDRLLSLFLQQIPPTCRSPMEMIRDLCDQRRQLHAQVRFHSWLHGWVLLHAPVSVLLIVLTIWHAIVASYLY